MYKKSVLFFMLISLFINWQSVFGADEPDGDSSKVLYKFNFFSLKRGHSIAESTLSINPDGTFSFEIKDEEIICKNVTYTQQGLGFKAEIDFKTSTDRTGWYKLSLTGINVLDVYIGGKAALKEFLDNNFTVQEITFLFTGSKKGSEEKKSPRLFK